MFQYRITRYDPRHRDSSGRYRGETWTSLSDVGRSFDGRILSMDRYQQVESAYLDTALCFMKQAGVRGLTVSGLENSDGSLVDGRRLLEGEHLPLARCREAFRAVLREQLWCRFEDAAAAFVHFGWDLYMYIGVHDPCASSAAFARQRGLFVEPHLSPYAGDHPL